MSDVNSLKSRLTAWSPQVLSLLRIMAGLLLMQHGLQKHFAFPEAMGMTMPATSLPMIAGWIELIGGFLIAVGLFTRCAAFVASGTMAVAYFKAHAPQGFYPLLNHGELAVLYCWVFFYFVFAGGGAWSVDALIGKKR
jgi:putative oxidoreductase